MNTEDDDLARAIQASLSDVNYADRDIYYSPLDSGRYDNSPLQSPAQARLTQITENNQRIQDLLSSDVFTQPPTSTIPYIDESLIPANILRLHQDREYQESLAEDRRRERERAEEDRHRAHLLLQENTRLAQQAYEEQILLDNLRSPTLKYNIDNLDNADLLILRIRSPQGIFTHSYASYEAFSTLIQQIRHDLRTLAGLTLSTGFPKRNLTCDPSTTLENCGLRNRTVIDVDIN